MAKKKIDLGERFDVSKTSIKEKYYPTMHVKDGLSPDMVGKTVNVQVEAKVVGMSQREGKDVEYDLELRSMTPQSKAQKSYTKSRKSMGK